MHPPAFNLFEVYSEGKRHLLHSLQVEGDSIRGIPSGDSRQCDACRIALATTDVDSVRTGGTDKSSTVGFGVVSGVILGYCLLVLAAYGAGAGGT